MIEKTHPELWFREFRPVNTAKLANDEKLRMVLMFKIINKKSKEEHDLIMSVVEKGNKAIVKNITTEKNKKDENGHTIQIKPEVHDVAEYPIEDVSDLIDEAFNQGITLAKMIANNNNQFSIDTNKPLFAMKIPPNQTKETIVEHMAEDDKPEGEPAKTIIKNILGLEEEITNTTIIPAKENQSFQTQKIELQKEAEELLIKKYGRKNILDLARKINYKGKIINTRNSHAYKQN